MKINDNLRKNCKPDPNYPFPNELNTHGQIVYSVPFEADSEEAAEVLHGKIRTIRVGGNEYRAVVFKPTTNRELAYSQRAWLNSEHTRALRRSQREIFFEGTLRDEDDEELARDEHPLLKDMEAGYLRAEYAEMVERIAEYIDAKHPRNRLYRMVYQLCVEERTPGEIAEELGIDPPMVYYYRNEGYKAAREYRKRYEEEEY